jgi:hypothetical protein
MVGLVIGIMTMLGFLALGAVVCILASPKNWRNVVR